MAHKKRMRKASAQRRKENKRLNDLAHGRHATWELSIDKESGNPHGTKQLLLALKNFMKSNKSRVSWKKMGLSESELIKIQQASEHHGLINQPAKKQKERTKRRCAHNAA
jgi:hypothetical protein